MKQLRAQVVLLMLLLQIRVCSMQGTEVMRIGEYVYKDPHAGAGRIDTRLQIVWRR
jgi:hypothetical protein